MYKFLLGVPSSVFAFASGLMVSVATSAATQIAFAEKASSNQNDIATSGVLALMAGVFWFWLSESLASAGRKVDGLAVAFKNRDVTINSLPRRTRATSLVLIVLAIMFSGAWPFGGALWRLLAQSLSSFRGLFA